jgi:hypothetical protein
MHIPKCIQYRLHKFNRLKCCKTSHRDKEGQTVRDLRLPPRCKWGLRSSGLLRSVDRWLVTDILGPIGCTEMSVSAHLGWVTCQQTEDLKHSQHCDVISLFASVRKVGKIRITSHISKKHRFFYVLSLGVLEKSYKNSSFFKILCKIGIARTVKWFLTGCSQLVLCEWHEIFSLLYWTRLDLGLTQFASNYVTGVLPLALKPPKPECDS